MARRSFAREFKESAARLVGEQGDNVAQAANNLGVDPGSIRDWVKTFATTPERATAPSSDGMAAQCPDITRILIGREFLPLNASIVRQSSSSDLSARLVFARASTCSATC